MKTILTACLLLSSLILMAQKTYVTSMVYTFSEGLNMPATGIGSDCGYPIKDVDVAFNTIDGFMEVTVNKKCHSWSFLQQWMGSAYASSIVFKNRYIEMRIQSTAAHDTGLSIGIQTTGGFPDGSSSIPIPPVKYKISKANTWETKLFKLGGTADTVFKEIDYFFPDGSYKIDYIYYGDAAIPPVPTINPVNTQMMKQSGVMYSVGLSGIRIPNRSSEGLKVEVKSSPGSGFFDTLYLTPSNDTLQSAILNYMISAATFKSSDSIIVSLKDSIRGTSNQIKFMVFTGATTKMTDETDEVKLYPNVITSTTTIEFTSASDATLQIIDMTGNVVRLIKWREKIIETIDLSDLAQGMYVARIVKGNSIFTHKIIKL